MSEAQPIIFADPDEITYDLKGLLVPVNELTDRQLRRAWHETFKQMGKISTEINDLEQKHFRRLRILGGISEATEARKLEPLPRITLVNQPINVD